MHWGTGCKIIVFVRMDVPAACFLRQFSMGEGVLDKEISYWCSVSPNLSLLATNQLSLLMLPDIANMTFTKLQKSIVWTHL